MNGGVRGQVPKGRMYKHRARLEAGSCEGRVARDGRIGGGEVHIPEVYF